MRHLGYGELVKSRKRDGKVKSSRCKARKSVPPKSLILGWKSEGMRRTCRCAAVTEDAAQHRRWTFYFAVRCGLGMILIIGLLSPAAQATSGKDTHLKELLATYTAHQENPPWLNYRFTVPPELKSKVNFWKTVYSKYTSDQVLIHDKQYLDIIYTVLDFGYLKDSNLSYWAQKRSKRKKVSEAKRKYKKILKRLAKPNLKLDKLGAEERRVYELFSSVNERHKFRKATGWRRIRSQVGQRDRFIQGLRNSGLYMREVEKIFANFRLPQELTLLPFVESFFNPDARSNDGAVGMWQFIRSTGRYYLQIDSVVDERKDPYKSSVAAARHLLANYKKLGSWPLAVTAYNHGAEGMRRAVRKTGRDDLVGIINNYRARRFGFASQNFYAEFLAVVEIVPNHDRYFGRLSLKPPLEFEVAKLPHYVSVNTLTKYCRLNKDEIKRLNPALKKGVLSSRKYIPEGYSLRIPPGTKDSFLKAYAQIPKKRQYVAQKQDTWHRVSWGETLSQIARRYRTTVSALVDLNNLSSSRYIRSGQRLRIPQASYRVSKKRTTKIAKAKPVTPRRTKAKKPAIQLAQADNKPAEVDTIIVSPHESVGHYADWAQVSASSVRRLNDLTYRQRIHVGQTIKVNYSKVGKQQFEKQRQAYHQQIQQEYMEKYKIERIQTHVIKPRQNVWYLCRYEYKIPLWLVEKYNQGKDLAQLNVGDKLLIPIVVRKL